MKIEVGKEYATRDSTAVVIYAIYPRQSYAVHGAIWSRDVWQIASWGLDGHYSATPEHAWDIVSELKG